MVLVAPSILYADFSRLGAEIAAVEKAGADWLHIDVMDGHFVPNITIGPIVIKHLRPVTKLTFDVHLMIDKPEQYVDAFAQAGADIITVHPESTAHLHTVISEIQEFCKAGVALNPATPLSVVDHVLDKIDLLLIMTVNPGFSGQSFIKGMIPKIAAAKKRIGDQDIILQVDGGIKPENVAAVKSLGVGAVVAGSSVFGCDDYKTAIKRLK